MATQICDRTIISRGLNYAEALSIIQEEDYLADEDFDDIRLFHKQGEVITSIESFEEKNSDDKLVDKKSYDGIFDYVNELVFDNRKLESLDRELVEEFDWNIFERQKRQTEIGTTIYTPGAAICPTGSNFTNIMCLVTPILIGCGLGLMMNPAPTNVPSGSPQPGTPGGGDVPKGNEPILNLIPDGLTPVAVFPPFLPGFRRGRNAEATIFKEEPGTFDSQDVGRRKRSYGYCPQPSFLERLRKNIKCLGPRLTQKFGRRKSKPVKNYGYHGKKRRDIGYGYNSFDDGCGECGTIEDCFDQPCPKYGYVATYQFNRDGQRSRQSNVITNRQTGEPFRTNAPPDCRTIAG